MTESTIAGGILLAFGTLAFIAAILGVLYGCFMLFVWPAIDRASSISMWKDFAKKRYPNQPMPGWIAAQIECIKKY